LLISIFGNVFIHVILTSIRHSSNVASRDLHEDSILLPCSVREFESGSGPTTRTAGGKLNAPRFGARMRGEGVFADQISQMFHVARRNTGLTEAGPEMSTASFRRREGPRLGLGL